MHTFVLDYESIILLPCRPPSLSTGILLLRLSACSLFGHILTGIHWMGLLWWLEMKLENSMCIYSMHASHSLVASKSQGTSWDLKKFPDCPSTISCSELLPRLCNIACKAEHQHNCIHCQEEGRHSIVQGSIFACSMDIRCQ